MELLPVTSIAYHEILPFKGYTGLLIWSADMICWCFWRCFFPYWMKSSSSICSHPYLLELLSLFGDQPRLWSVQDALELDVKTMFNAAVLNNRWWMIKYSLTLQYFGLKEAWSHGGYRIKSCGVIPMLGKPSKPPLFIPPRFVAVYLSSRSFF